MEARGITAPLAEVTAMGGASLTRADRGGEKESRLRPGQGLSLHAGTRCSALSGGGPGYLCPGAASGTSVCGQSRGWGCWPGAGWRRGGRSRVAVARPVRLPLGPSFHGWLAWLGRGCPRRSPMGRQFRDRLVRPLMWRTFGFSMLLLAHTRLLKRGGKGNNTVPFQQCI